MSPSVDHKRISVMETIIHKADTRGHASHGWLDAHHSFSFAGYYDPSRMHFGVLRVLNDDRIAPGMGFGMHPHDNMEIISIALEGSLKHKDNLGNEGVIRPGDVQVMSAGTGVVHSEFNPSKEETVNLLQIWAFPRARGAQPRYDQKTFDPASRKNGLQVVVAPDGQEGALWINQDAWFSLGQLDQGGALTYRSRLAGNGSYIFVISGSLEVGLSEVEARDGVGLTDFERVDIKAASDAQFLIMDVPMS
jgi:redox-sensitive bicupin YhaK (pirin superfamily)